MSDGTRIDIIYLGIVKRNVFKLVCHIKVDKATLKTMYSWKMK